MWSECSDTGENGRIRMVSKEAGSCRIVSVMVRILKFILSEVSRHWKLLSRRVTLPARGKG